MKDSIVIEGPKLETINSGSRLSANVNGEEIYFHSVSRPIPEMRGEPFLAVILAYAMYHKKRIKIHPDLPVSGKVMENLEHIMDILCCWNKKLSHTKIDAKIKPQQLRNEKGICSFSGGIDSAYAYHMNRDHVSYLLLIQGFDAREGAKDWPNSVSMRKEFASKKGVCLVPVETNVRDVTEGFGISWKVTIGFVLSTIACLFGDKKYFLPASHTYDRLEILGTHPLIDTHWSTEATQIIHYGAGKSRTEKTRAIAGDQEILDQLQVCWKSAGTNCGVCSKCIRTALALEIMGAKSKSIPEIKDRSLLKNLKPDSESTLDFIDDLAEMAKSYGQNELYNQLYRYRKPFLVKHAAQEFFKAVMPQKITSVLRKQQKWREEINEIDLQDYR